MTVVTLYSLLDIEVNVFESYLSPEQKPTTAQVIQENTKLKSFFDLLEYSLEAMTAATETLMHVFEDYSPPCYAAHWQRTFLENNNIIIFTDEDMEVDFLDH